MSKHPHTLPCFWICVSKSFPCTIIQFFSPTIAFAKLDMFHVVIFCLKTLWLYNFTMLYCIPIGSLEGSFPPKWKHTDPQSQEKLVCPWLLQGCTQGQVQKVLHWPVRFQLRRRHEHNPGRRLRRRLPRTMEATTVTTSGATSQATSETTTGGVGSKDRRKTINSKHQIQNLRPISLRHNLSC